MSSRFEGDDNLWIKLWGSTSAVAAARQKQLFDCTREAEQTLQFFETMTIADLNVQLLPCVLNEAVRLVQGRPAMSSCLGSAFTWIAATRPCAATRIIDLSNSGRRLCPIVQYVTPRLGR